MDVYNFDNYVDVLEQALSGPDSKWGAQSRLAQAAGCQRSYLSQVLKGKATLTQDQAIGIAEYLGFTNEELQYFLQLVSLARASSEKLRKFYRESLKQIRSDKENLAKRFRVTALADTDKQALYYSTWLHCAVHILVGIEGFHTPVAIANRLSVSKDLANQALQELLQVGLVEEFKRGHWRNTQSTLHLPAESPLTSVNHMNWRQRAVMDSTRRTPSSVHYTAVMSISKRDIPALKALILETVDKSRTLVRASGKEEVICMCCDLFEIR